MKNLALVIRLAGMVFVSSGVSMAGDKPAVTPAVPVVKKDSGHAVPPPATMHTAPSHLPPSLPKPVLPVNAGKLHGNVSVGGSTGASGHKDGTLNGTEIKRHP